MHYVHNFILTLLHVAYLNLLIVVFVSNL